MEFRDLKKQYSLLKEDIDRAVLDVTASAAFINGKPVKELERELAEYVGVRHCITCGNGTDALTIALKVWGIGPDDEVLVPDFTFFSSAETVAAEGATPVFVDVDAQTYNIDVPDLEKKIQTLKNPKAIIAVDLFGQPANYPAIRAVADRYGLLILEDGAQGFGGMIGDRRACSFGDISTTSFFPAKPLGCYGDGGAIFTDNDEWASLAESYRVHGKGTFKYDNVRIGMNSRLDTIQAAILQVKLRAFRDYELRDVNEVARKYTDALTSLAAGNVNGITALPHVPHGFLSSWAQYTIQLDSHEHRDAMQAKLKAHDIPSMVYYPKGMHAQTAFAYLHQPSVACPVTQRLTDTVLSLPMHPYLTDQDIATIVEVMKR